jgi:predicted RNA polymerase sigma factor
VQEALLSAATQWPVQGVPDNPQGWLVTVASRRRIESYRAESARRRREEYVVVRDAVDGGESAETGDTLTLLFLCCHPSLTLASKVALTLRAVGGLTTAEIARAYLVPESTIALRISRAKQRIRAAGATFELPPDAEPSARMDAVLRVLYLIFTEGHTASSGTALCRIDLTTEAMRLTRQVRERLPVDGEEVAGLLALMLLTDARRAARVRQNGSLVPLAEQDRTRWDRTAITEGVTLIQWALAHAPLGPYQLQAAIIPLSSARTHRKAQPRSRTADGVARRSPYMRTALAVQLLPDEEGEALGEGRMEFLEHLEELRSRLIWCCVSITVKMLAAFAFIDTIVTFVLAPSRRMLPPVSRLIYTQPGEGFGF